ncbi:unnamed protein product, partial [Symbiodinium microadriaticum]
MQIDLGNLNALLGPAILQQIQEQIQRAVAQAVQQALQGLNLEGASSVQASRASAPNARPAPQENEDEEWQQPKRKRRRKGKGSGEGNVAAAVSPPASTPELPRAANPGKGQGKGKGKGEVPRNAQPLSAGRGKVHQAGTGKSKGKGSVVQPSQPAGQESEWQVVTRKRSPAPVGDFTLRPEDWDAPIVTFEQLATFIEKAKEGTTVEAVVHVSKEQEAVTASLIRGAGRPYKFLVLFLDKSEGSRRTPGTIDGKLVFRQAVVKELSSGAGGSAPRPKGAGATAVKMQPSVDTVVIFLRVLKSFAPAEQWKGFGLNPNKTVVQWASQHRVRVLDTFSWALEKPRAEAGEQYYGMARVRKSDLEAFLKLSGQQGVFVDTARRHGIQTSISWIDKLPGETTSAYHERAVRQGADLGVVVKANKLAWRKKLAEGEVEKRMWQVDGLPIEWDEDGVTKLLESAFAEIQILTHRRTKLGQNFRFKAAASQKDKDLIPLVAEQDGITTTYWASWALPANVSIRRKPLPRKAVPVAQIPAIKTTTVATPAVQEETQAHDGDQDMEATDKPKPEPKRVKQEVKVPPEDLLLKPMPKDGSCLFHAVSEGLKWLQDERDSHPRVLRAQVLEHMKRHRDTYLPEWDKMDPKGQPFSGTFEEYLAAMEQPTAFASDIEFKALARLLDIKLVVVPSGVHFQPMAFHHKAKRMLVLWYDALHIDLLLPKNEGSYPVHYQQVTAGPTAGLRAGGASSVFTASSGTKAAQVRQAGRPPSVFTASTGLAQAPGATAREKTPAETRSVAKRSFPTVAARRTQVPGQVQEAVSDAESQDLQGCEVTAGKRAVCTTKWRDCPYKVLPKPPPDLVFKCKLCPFRKLCKSAAHYRGVRHKHDKQAHEGVSLPGPLLQPRMQRLPQKLSPGDWRCPLCKEGAVFVKVLTANTNRTGAAKTPLLVEFLRQESIQLASLQEVDINVESAVGFCTHWKSQGCTAVLAPLDADRCQHRVALISSLPIKPVTLGNDFDCSRVAAGLVGNLPKTSLLVESLFEKTVTFGGPVLALGDWNAVEEEGVLARHLASGRLIPLDDGDRSDLRYTNPTRTRRIDYGVSTAHIRADAVLHYDRDDISVHLCVGYSLDLETWRECAALPNFKTVGHTDQQVIQSRFADAWAQPVLEALLADADVDQALAHLYTVAETCLAPECATDAKATSRAHLWDPVQKKSCPHHATVDGHASLALHTLRKLSGQLRQLRCQPFDCSLRAATRKRCGDLRQRLPDCPFFDLDDLETTLAKVDALLRDLSAQEKQAHVARWKAEAQDVTAATAWVKRWASRRVELDAPPCELAKAPTDIHPASIVRTQSQVWMDKWTCDSESFNSEGLAEILSTLPRLLGVLLAEALLTRTAQRLFKVLRVTGEKWQTPSQGLLQGCPLSPLCALLIGNVWQSYVTQGPARALIFVDDRLLWAEPEAENAEAALADGVTRSNFFDSVMKFTCRPSKCAVVESKARPNLRALTTQLGYPTRHHLEVLGLTVFDLDSGDAGLLKLNVATLQARLRALSILSPPFKVARTVCASLVFAGFAWAAGIAAPTSKDLNAIRLSIHHALRSRITGETPWVLFAEVHGWQWDPKWLLQWRALGAVWREAGLATGLNLEAPSLGARFALAGHRLLGHSQSLDVRRAALATGGSGWYHRHRIPTQRYAEVKCLCTLLWPSRPHLTWNCPRTAEHRRGLRGPTNRVEERLFGAPVPEYPAAPDGNQVPEMVQAMRTHFCLALTQDTDNLLVATDGSHQHGVGACAVATESAHGTFSAGDDAEDQSPFRFEMVALNALLQALPHGQLYHKSTVTILVDCQSALDSVQCPDALRRDYKAVRLVWVPSHDKRLDWQPPFGLDDRRCRDLNNKADRAANQRRDSRARAASRVAWHRRLDEAERWEVAAISAAAASSALLYEHLKPVPLPTPPPSPAEGPVV